jgi:hypothetical protein
LEQQQSTGRKEGREWWWRVGFDYYYSNNKNGRKRSKGIH